MAGIEVDKKEKAPEGWKKWVMPARKYLVTEVMFEHYMETFKDVLENQIPSKNMKLSGAACDYTEPSTGKHYIFFPVENYVYNVAGILSATFFIKIKSGEA